MSTLTDIARYKNSKRTDYLISNWHRNRNTIEFIGIGEQRNNPVFNPVKFDGIRKQAGLNSRRRADMKPMTTLILSADGAAAYRPRNALGTARPSYRGLKARPNRRTIDAVLQPLHIVVPITQRVAWLVWQRSKKKIPSASSTFQPTVSAKP